MYYNNLVHVLLHLVYMHVHVYANGDCKDCMVYIDKAREPSDCACLHCKKVVPEPTFSPAPPGISHHEAHEVVGLWLR